MKAVPDDLVVETLEQVQKQHLVREEHLELHQRQDRLLEHDEEAAPPAQALQRMKGVQDNLVVKTLE